MIDTYFSAYSAPLRLCVKNSSAVVRSRNRPLRVGATLGEATEPSGASAEGSGASGSGVKIAIIPLLFEAHWEKNFDIICCVVSSREKQIERMMTTRGMTLAEAEARLAAQMPVEEKSRRSQYVIRNDGTAEELRAEAQKLVDWLSTTQPPNHLTT